MVFEMHAGPLSSYFLKMVQKFKNDEPGLLAIFLWFCGIFSTQIAAVSCLK